MAIIETQIASYKGVEFLMLSASISGGRKDVLFEFPNSNKQTVEDLGLKVRSYEMTAVIPHDDYYIKRNRLLAVLEEGGNGTLIHPTDGTIENVRARTFVLNEKISDLGRAEIQLAFAVDDDIGVPQKAANSVSEVEAANEVLAEQCELSIAEEFEVDTGFSGNFQAAKELLNDVTDAIDSAVATAAQVTDKVNQFSAQVNQFTSDIAKLIAIPLDLASSVTNLFSTVNGLFSTVKSTAAVYSELFGFGDDDVEIKQTTAGLTQRAKNRAKINQVMQASSLGYAYLNSVQVEFQTTEDIDAVNTLLDEQYEKISANQEFSEEVKRAITDVRTISNQLFDDKRAAAKKVIEVYTHRAPMSEIAYQYYGSTVLTGTLLELNNISNGAFVEGTIKILTE